MSLEIKVVGHGACVTVEVFGYENPSAEDISDANWIRCQVKVKIGEREFSADFPASLTTHDFAQFREELGTVLGSLDGTASFLSDEEALCLTILLRRTGSAEVKGVAQVCDKPKGTLTFSFESDQSFLSRTLHDLQALTEEFPVKEH